jgi:hypothetical protein
VELASCHPSGAWNFKVAPRVLKTTCSDVLETTNYVAENVTSYLQPDMQIQCMHIKVYRQIATIALH